MEFKNYEDINKKGIEAIWRDYELTISISLFSLSIVLILLGIYFKELYGSSISLIDIISISIGITGLISALWSIQSTTISFKEIQADYWNTRGIDKVDKKDYHNAYQAYDKAIDIDPQSIKCWINKANALLEQGRRYREKSSLISALNTIEVVIEKGPKFPATLRKNSLKETKAKQEYANALKTKCDILLELADVSEKDTNLPTSPSQIKRAELNFVHLHFMNSPQDCDILKSLVSIETLPSSLTLRTCAFKISKEAIEKYPKKNPEVPGAYVSKGNALLKLGEFYEAIRAFEKAISFWETIGRDTNGAIAWGAKGNAHLAKGKALDTDGNHEAASKAYENAIEAYEKAIELKPDAAKTWLSKGNALRAQRKYDEATHAYNKAIEFEPLLSDAWNQRGNVLVEQANALIRKNVGRNWSNTSDAIFMQRNYYYSEALRSYSMAIDINPRDEVAWDNKGNVLTYIGEFDDAIRAHNKAIMLNSQYALARSNKGFTLFYKGKYDDAIKAYDEAIELDHDFANAWKGRGDVLKTLGRSAEAEAAYAKAKELGYSG